MQLPELQMLAAAVLADEGPIGIERLRQGVVNETYRVARGDSVYAFRVEAARGVALGVEREWESRVLLTAATAGIASPLVYADPQRGIWVTRWAEGHTWAPGEARSSEAARRMADLLRRIHALAPPPPWRAMPPAAWINRYRGGTLPQALAQRAADHVARLDRHDIAAVLCHSDLHVLNLVDDGCSLRLLDWEYAHLSDPFWDVAGWCANNDFDDSVRRSFLDLYLGRAASAAEFSRLETLLWLYDYVCLLWSEVYLRTPDSSAVPAVTARAACLQARLET